MAFTAETKAETKEVKVLYIAGTMRSGSTLLARLLGELPQAVNVGELGLLFSPDFQRQGRCGCLERVYDCDFWRAVFQCAFGGIDRLDTKLLHEIKQAYRIRTLPRLLRESPSRAGVLQEYSDALEALYRAVQQVSGARVIVDASKDPVYGYLLARMPGVDLRAVHLVRDSRAVAYSQQRPKADPPLFPHPTRLPAVKPVSTALTWNAVNMLLACKPMSRRRAFLRYEDFVADPRAAISGLWALMGEPLPPLDFLKERSMRLRTNHTVAGNPDRFHADVTVRPDVQWRENLSSRDRLLVTALTLPLLRRYGYLAAPPGESRTRIQPTRVF